MRTPIDNGRTTLTVEMPVEITELITWVERFYWTALFLFAITVLFFVLIRRRLHRVKDDITRLQAATNVITDQNVKALERTGEIGQNCNHHSRAAVDTLALAQQNARRLDRIFARARDGDKSH